MWLHGNAPRRLVVGCPLQKVVLRNKELHQLCLGIGAQRCTDLAPDLQGSQLKAADLSSVPQIAASADKH
jgi:hypothetical protein